MTIGTKPGLPGTGTITDGANSFSVTKELTGTLILGAANTYDGGTFVNQGIVNIQNNQALGTGLATVLDGAQLQLQSDTAGNSITVNNALRIRPSCCS